MGEQSINRKAGLKAKANLIQRFGSGYYKAIAKLGGRAVPKNKRTFARLPELARNNAQKRWQDRNVEYSVMANTRGEAETGQFVTREDARRYKQSLRRRGVKSRIIKRTYVDDTKDFIVEEKEVW